MWLLHQIEQIQSASDGNSNLFDGFNCLASAIILSNVKNITSPPRNKQKFCQLSLTKAVFITSQGESHPNYLQPGADSCAAATTPRNFFFTNTLTIMYIFKKKNRKYTYIEENIQISPPQTKVWVRLCLHLCKLKEFGNHKRNLGTCY
jgi:hypothetical protein